MVDWTKPIQRRDGQDARVVCMDVDNGGEVTVGQFWFWYGKRVMKNQTAITIPVFILVGCMKIQRRTTTTS